MQQTNEDVLWYVGTRKDSKAHHVVNENYMEKYENEFESIREFDTLEDATEALKAREAADVVYEKKPKKKIAVSKVRGNIRKGSISDEELRAKMRKEIEAEIKAETVKSPSRTRGRAKKETTE